MRSARTWAAYVLFALCLVGMVAWPLWSDSDVWMILFAAVGIAVMFPVIFGRSIRAVLDAFLSSDPR